jgi:hypothetical protein
MRFDYPGARDLRQGDVGACARKANATRCDRREHDVACGHRLRAWR